MISEPAFDVVVFVSAWELEEELVILKVGERVNWLLELQLEQEPPVIDDAWTDLDFNARPLDSDWAKHATVLAHKNLRCICNAPGAWDGPRRVRGILQALLSDWKGSFPDSAELRSGLRIRALRELPAAEELKEAPAQANIPEVTQLTEVVPGQLRKASLGLLVTASCEAAEPTVPS